MDNMKKKINLSLPERLLREIKEYQDDNFGIDQTAAIAILLAKAINSIKNDSNK